MRHPLIVLLFVLAGCGGSTDGVITTPPPGGKKPDPYLTIRVLDLMDTTTAPGRAHWHNYILLTGPYTALNGITRAGAFDLPNLRYGHNLNCIGVGADSVGQRLISVLGIADTTTSALTPDAHADTLAAAWYAGNHTLPSGWMALTFAPQDAWQSAQYVAGHGLTPADPIRWGFDWTARGTTTFYERTDTSINPNTGSGDICNTGS